MLAQVFQRHCTERHRQTMRFRTKNEHEQDHRLHQDRLDHIHTDQQASEPEGPEAGNGGNTV